MNESKSNDVSIGAEFPYEVVLILDRLTLTGKIIVDEVNKLAGRHCSLHALNISSLREVLLSPIMRRKKILVIAELVTDSDSLHDGFTFIDELTYLSEIIGLHRCMIYTALLIFLPLLCVGIGDRNHRFYAARRWPALNRYRPHPQRKLRCRGRIIDIDSRGGSRFERLTTGILQLYRDVACRPLIGVITRCVRWARKTGGDFAGADRTSIKR